MAEIVAGVKKRRGIALGSGLDTFSSKRQAVVMVRWVLVTAAAYLMLFSGTSNPTPGVMVVVALLLGSNVVIGRLPERVVAHAGFDLMVLLSDTVLLSLGFYLSSGITSDFYLIYFFIIFLAGVSERLSAVLLGSLLAAGAYLSLGWAGLGEGAQIPESSMLLRVAFIFAVALFYGFLVERIRLDREKRTTEHYARLERVNARLRELVELRESFVGSVSHELRTPLNAMLGYMDLVRDGAVGDIKPAAAHYIDKAYGRGVHLMRLIEELLSFASLAKGHAGESAEPASVAEVLDRIRDVAMASARAKKLQFRVDADPSVAAEVVDGAKLTQILLHLVTNAIKFTDRGEIVVRAAVRDGTLTWGWSGPVLEVTVRDTGRGIPAELHDAIFEEFRQGDLGNNRRQDGIGLGLAVCRGLVDLLRGDLTLVSEVGRGSTFTVRLPVGAGASLEAERSEAAQMAAH